MLLTSKGGDICFFFRRKTILDIIGICFGVRVFVMIRLMFVHYTLSSVWGAEWPPFEK